MWYRRTGSSKQQLEATTYGSNFAWPLHFWIVAALQDAGHLAASYQLMVQYAYYSSVVFFAPALVAGNTSFVTGNKNCAVLFSDLPSIAATHVAPAHAFRVRVDCTICFAA